MVKCVHCSYTVGWVGDERLEHPEGEFYKVGEANRFHGDKNDMFVMGCPRCHKIFLSEEDI
ncbi:UNVERIFIED_ORG: hypothetical protein GCAPEGMB_00406 [Vibrio phage V07]